ncbi:hypothetical protein [Streptomyces blastmyceticus]|uniref:hypothetical protein n=1 Tax=Streptomyces blastmyceticus TaxID=68180 RepID=UPI0031DB75C6
MQMPSGQAIIRTALSAWQNQLSFDGTAAAPWQECSPAHLPGHNQTIDVKIRKICSHV